MGAVEHVVAHAEIVISFHLPDQRVVPAAMPQVLAFLPAQARVGEELGHFLFSILVGFAVGALVAEQEFEVRIILIHQAG